MNAFQELFSNRVLLCAITSWMVAQVLKFLLNLWIHKKMDWRRFFGMGGMPSAHSAFVFSLSLATGIGEGFDSIAFALAFALMAIVIYDAMGVRAETGKQGAVLNHILREVLIEGQPITEERLKELVGHTPLEVLGGVLIGALMALIMM